MRGCFQFYSPWRGYWAIGVWLLLVDAEFWIRLHAFEQGQGVKFGLPVAVIKLKYIIKGLLSMCPLPIFSPHLDFFPSKWL